MKFKFIDWVALNIVAILFILGLVLVNTAIYQIYSPQACILSSGITLIIVAVIIAYERG